jgi:hypothetical protein
MPVIERMPVNESVGTLADDDILPGVITDSEGPADGGADADEHDGGADGGAEGPADGGADGDEHDGGADGSA